LKLKLENGVRLIP